MSIVVICRRGERRDRECERDMKRKGKEERERHSHTLTSHVETSKRLRVILDLCLSGRRRRVIRIQTSVRKERRQKIVQIGVQRAHVVHAGGLEESTDALKIGEGCNYYQSSFWKSETGKRPKNEGFKIDYHQ